ncbi:MAG TPA: alpha/beta hydrolase domain-containing protein [Candidatus Anammoximicrobium sp.]|nr:alpha/beta hydrolase domain-containing protein [Candidatus Anammoximicrobium sp.]
MSVVRRFVCVGIWLSFLFPQWASAEVVRVEIRECGPFADGCVFGRSGPYERIVGRLHFEVNPAETLNAGITDLQRAPRNAAGRVEFWSDFFLLKPVDPARGNRRLLYDVNNRGNKLALWTFNEARGNNPSTAADAGNGFLMREGWSVLWCGWSGDVMPGDDRLLAGFPVAKENGQPITGKIHAEICRDEPVGSSPLYWTPWALSNVYPPVSLDTRQAKLTMRPKRSEPAVEIPPDQWAFARLEGDKPVADAGSVWVKGGLRPGWLYELVYEGQEPRVSGLGFAAVRDGASFFRYEKADRHETANPLAGAIERAHIFGISQSGRFVNHFVYDGFNTDERQRIVFDGALSHVSGSGRGLFNHRFGMSTLCAGHHENLLTPSESFPFTTLPQSDPVTVRSGDLLARARAQGHVPKIMFTQTSTEYWTRGASLLHTDVAGTKDVELDPNARLYVVAGAQHLGGTPTDRGLYQNPRNPLNDRPYVLRALLVALDQWASADKPPPESRYPRIADGTLVDLETFRKQFPQIPGVQLPAGYYMPLRLDFGPRWLTEGIADCVPPNVGPAYRTLVPAVDADGNEVAGIRLPDVAVPLATYTGWNLRSAEAGAEGMLAPYNGSYLVFPATREQRLQTGDPRPSVAERYPTREAYLARVTEAILQLREQRLLLPEDAVALLKAAAEHQRQLATGSTLPHKTLKFKS